ncbi:hypothetical protein BOTBODRAFT_181351 [Botryobasidium botryosum FD-172 SS1]|uniref:Uncharacterized protein n=1 Tax=Botryobasidium botryosum (strain FD-172 SS1) TaxID=930990 RepID=A0A067LWM2_BOTB1|nr:hypothetical protein BOTBODRAFT_181351 [Botryobasidium botryosum FD-172 SS1]
MSSNASLSILQDLIRVIVDPKWDSRFVVLSKATRLSWTIQLGLISEDTRWWGATWKDAEIRRMASVDTIRDAFVQGDLRIEKWDEDTLGAPLQITLCTSSSNPLSFSLNELGSVESSSKAMQVLYEIATHAQKGACTFKPGEETLASKEREAQLERQVKSHEQTISNLRAQIQKLQAVANADREYSPPPLSAPGRAQATVAIPKATKGRSLANPTKKVRRVEELEWED